MGWHDSQIHAMAFSPANFELILDIDYILEWIHPKPEETYYKFWVAPATLVFENVYEVDINTWSYSSGLEIDAITRKDIGAPRNAEFIRKAREWLWTIECQEGEITFRSAGYKQYIRTYPVFGGQQTLDLSSRGLSFDRKRTDID
jgi:hypothetical protein